MKRIHADGTRTMTCDECGKVEHFDRGHWECGWKVRRGPSLEFPHIQDEVIADVCSDCSAAIDEEPSVYEERGLLVI